MADLPESPADRRRLDLVDVGEQVLRRRRRGAFLPFESFPWFRSGTIAQISTVERPTADHLHWPLLDVDFSLQSIRKPAAFPLVARPRG